MPLKKGSSKETFRENVRKLYHEHYKNGRWDKGWSRERVLAVAFRIMREARAKKASRSRKRGRRRKK